MLPAVDIADDKGTRFVKTPARQLLLIRQPTPEPLPSPPFAGRLFPCLLWDDNGGRSFEEQRALISTLMESGCRYFVCGGRDASAWEAAADEAFVMSTLDLEESERDARMVMTTSHKGESMDDVALFFACCTNFDTHSFADFLIVVVGADEGLALSLMCLVSSHL